MAKSQVKFSIAYETCTVSLEYTNTNNDTYKQRTQRLKCLNKSNNELY